MKSANERRAWTVGHSTLPIDDFVALLKRHGIRALADVRRFPASRKHPQFNADALERSLREAGIDYAAFTELGGRRRARPDSRNTAWRNESFRGYADYTETAAFEAAFLRLSDLIQKKQAAIMCAEGLWWRCHRALISDQLKVKGFEVLHILPDGEVAAHPYTSAARVSGGKVYYGPGDDLLGRLG